MLKLNADDPTLTKVQTRDGREAKILEIFEGRIFGRRKCSFTSCWIAAYWDMKGDAIDGTVAIGLENIPQKRLLDVWIVVTKGTERGENNGYYFLRAHEAQAINLGDKSAILHRTLEYTVGEGLDQ